MDLMVRREGRDGWVFEAEDGNENENEVLEEGRKGRRNGGEREKEWRGGLDGIVNDENGERGGNWGSRIMIFLSPLRCGCDVLRRWR